MRAGFDGWRGSGLWWWMSFGDAQVQGADLVRAGLAFAFVISIPAARLWRRFESGVRDAVVPSGRSAPMATSVAACELALAEVRGLGPGLA